VYQEEFFGEENEGEGRGRKIPEVH